MRALWVRRFSLFLVLFSIALASRAYGSTYSGSLTYTAPADASDGFIVQGAKWPGYNFTLSWTVTDEDNSQPGYAWKYSYRFQYTNPSGNLQSGISHLIVEVSEAFGSEDDMKGLTGAALGTTDTLQKANNGNPDMPSDLYGLKFTPNGTSYDMNWSFFSNRAPVWGDFYARGGSNPTDTLYNKGFSVADPTAAPANGSIDDHILRPDTTITPSETVVPLPASAWMGMVMLGGLVIWRRRRMTGN